MTFPTGKVKAALRPAASTILVILGVVMLTAAPVAMWARGTVLNTDRFVSTVAPLADEEGVQDAVIAAVNRAVSNRLDVSALLGGVLPGAAADLIGPPLERALVDLIDDRVTGFVRSDAFASLWVDATRKAHAELELVLTGESEVVGLDDSGTITLDLGPIVERVRDRLVAAGIAAASQIPTSGVTIVVAQVGGLTSVQEGTRLLDRYAPWLLWLGLLLVAAGIAVARRRRRALIASMGLLATAMALLAVALLVGRGYVASAAESTALSRPTAEVLFDTIVRRLRAVMRIVLAVALAIAFGAWVSGPSAASTRAAAREVVRTGRARVRSGPVGRFICAHANAIRIGAASLGLVALVFWSDPTAGVAIGIGIAVAVVVLATLLLAPGAEPALAGSDEPSAPGPAH